jgi:hypothetical protein
MSCYQLIFTLKFIIFNRVGTFNNCNDFTVLKIT